MARGSRTGVCHICGQHGQLSFEHVPPKSAFNDGRVRNYSGLDALELVQLEPGEGPKGEVQQRGVGGYTLCLRCNNFLGRQYVPAFAEWSYQGMYILRQASGRPTVYAPYWIYPLRVIKQILAMFFSVNRSEFRTNHSYLEGFVLNPERRYLPPKYHVYSYFTLSTRSRMIGVAGRVSGGGERVTLLSEIAFPPFGYVLAFDPVSPDHRLVEITHFADAGYDDFSDVWLNLPRLDVYSPLPADFRTPSEVRGER